MLNASSRPQVRPNSWLQTNLPRKVATRGGEVPLGTLMVQLGAFSDENTALEAWKRLSERYGDYFVGKEATILNGKIAEQKIYRLRVYGFNDINESRRLCTALHGQNAECYPVVMN
ncbi:MAG: SPOR domain-containing protein, partial [Planktomarina sp.]|nr:SPOR domain-containing protein [Planktomarina sp.]